MPDLEATPITLIDILTVDEATFQAHLDTTKTRLFQAFGQGWEAVEDEPILDTAYAVAESEIFDAFFRLVKTEHPGVGVHIPSWDHTVTFSTLSIRTAPLVLEQIRELNAAWDADPTQPEPVIDTQLWFKALAMENQLTNKQYRIIRPRLSRLVNLAI